MEKRNEVIPLYTLKYKKTHLHLNDLTPDKMARLERSMKRMYPELEQHVLTIDEHAKQVLVTIRQTPKLSKRIIAPTERNRTLYIYFVRSGIFGDHPVRVSQVLAILGQDDWHQRILPYVVNPNYVDVTHKLSLAQISEAPNPPAVPSKVEVHANIAGSMAEEGGYEDIVGKRVLLVKRFPQLSCAIVEHEDKRYVVREQDLYLNGMDKSSYEENYEQRWEDHEYF